MENLTFGKEVNLNGKLEYNTDKIIDECEKLYNDRNKFVEYLSKILNEKQKDLLVRLYSIADKKFIFLMVEKTLKIMNDGGMETNQGKTDNNDIKIRTISGTFIYLIKKSDVLSQKEIKNIFWRNYKKKNEKKKFVKKFDKMIIKNDNNDTISKKNLKEKEKK